MKLIYSSIFFYFILISACFAREVVIGKGEGDSPPYYFIEDNKLVGICPDVISEAALAVGIQVVFSEYPWKRMMFLAEKGEIDGVMPVYKTEEREKFLFFIPTPLAFDPFGFFTHKDSPLKNYSGKLQEFKDTKIGVITGFSYGKEFDEATYLEREPAKDEESLIRKFKGKRFEVGIGNPYVLGYYAEKFGIANDMVFLDPMVSKEPLFFALSKKKDHQILSEQLDKAIQEIKTTGKYREILNRYKVPFLKGGE